MKWLTIMSNRLKRITLGCRIKRFLNTAYFFTRETSQTNRNSYGIMHFLHSQIYGIGILRMTVVTVKSVYQKRREGMP